MKRATCGKEGTKPARSFISGRSSSKNVHSWIERTKTEGKNRKWANRGRRVKNSGDDEAENKLDDLLDAFETLQARVNKVLSLSTGESQENFKKHSDLYEVLKKEVLDFNTNNNVLGRLISELGRLILEKYKYINVPEVRLDPLVNDEVHGLDSSSENPLLLHSNIVDDFPLYGEDNEKRKADPPTSSEVTGDHWLPSEIQDNADALAGVRSEARQTLENNRSVATDDMNVALSESGPSEATASTYPKKNCRKRALLQGNASQGAAVGDDSSLALKRYCEWNWERISQEGQAYGMKWPYLCDICLGRFINEDILMRHRITHGSITDHPNSSWKQLYSIPYNEEAPPIKRRRKWKRKTEFGVKWRQSFIRATRHGRFLRPRKKMNYRVDCADSDSIDSRSVKSPPVPRPSTHRKRKSHLKKSHKSISADQLITDNAVPDIATDYSLQSSAPAGCIKEQSSGAEDRSSSGALKENEESIRVSTSTDAVNSIRNNGRTSVGSDEDISVSISGIDYLGSLFITTSPKVAGTSDELSPSPRAIEDQSQSVSEENSIGCHSKEKAHECTWKSQNAGFHSSFKKFMEPRHQEGEQSNISKESSTKEVTPRHKEDEATAKDQSEIVERKKKEGGHNLADWKRKTNEAMLENSSSQNFFDTPKIPKDRSDSSTGTSENISSIADNYSADEFSMLRRSKLKKLRVSSSDSQENERDSVKYCSCTQKSIGSGEKEVIDARTNSVGIGKEKNHCSSSSRNSKTQEDLHKAPSRTLKDNSNSRKKNEESLDGISRKVGTGKVQVCGDQRRKSRIDTVECKKTEYPKSSKFHTHLKGDCHGTLKMVSKSSDDETRRAVDERALSKEGQKKFKRDLSSSSSSNSVTIVRANVKSAQENFSDLAVSKKHRGKDSRSIDSSPSTRSNPEDGSDTDSSKVRTPSLSAPKTYKPLKYPRSVRASSSSSSSNDASRDELKRALNTSECNNKKRMLIQILSNSQSRGIIARARGCRQNSSDRNANGPTVSNTSNPGMESSKLQKIARRRSTSALIKEKNLSAHNSNGTSDSEESEKSVSNSDTKKISKSIKDRDAYERQDSKFKKKSRTSSSHSSSRTSSGGNESSELKSSAPRRPKMNAGGKRRSETGAQHRSSSHSVDDERINRGTKSSASFPAVEKSTKCLDKERKSSESTEAASRKVSTAVEKTSKALCKETTNEKRADDLHSNPKTVEKAKCARKDKEGNASTVPSTSSRKHHHSVHRHVTKAAKDMHSNPETYKAKSQKENKKRSLSSSGHERDFQVKAKKDGFKSKVSHSADTVTGKSPINSERRSCPEKKTVSNSSGHLTNGKKKDEGGKQDGLDTDTAVKSKRDACLQSKASGTSSHNRHQSMDKDPTQAGSIRPEKSKAAKPHKDNRKRGISADANTSLGHKHDYQVETKRELFKSNISCAAGDETSKSKINAKGSCLEKRAECPSSRKFSNGKKKVEGSEQSGSNPATVGYANKDKCLQATASSTSSHNSCHSADEHPTQAAKNIDSNPEVFKAGKSEKDIEKIFLPAVSNTSSAHRHTSQTESKKQGFKYDVSNPGTGETPMNSKGSRPLKQKKECRFCDTTNGKGKDENGKQHSSSPAALGKADKDKCLQASAQSTKGHNSYHSGSTQPTSAARDILSNPEESRAKKHQKDSDIRNNKRCNSVEASLVQQHDSQAKTKKEHGRSKGSRSASGKTATPQVGTKESSPAKKKEECSSSSQFSNGERKDKGSEQPGSNPATIEESNKEKCLESKESHNSHHSVDGHPTQGARSSHTNPEASRPKKHYKKSSVSVEGSGSSSHKHDPQVKTKSRVSDPDDGAKSQMNTKGSRPPKEKKEKGSSASHLINGKTKDEDQEQHESDSNVVVDAKIDECPRSKATNTLIHQALSSHPTEAGKRIHSNPEAFKAEKYQEDNWKISHSSDGNSPTGHKHNSQDDTGKEDFKSNISHPAVGETAKSPMNSKRSRPPETKHESSSSWNLTNAVEKSEGGGSDSAVVGEASEDKIRPENIGEMSRESNSMNPIEVNQSKARNDESCSLVRANMSHNDCSSEEPSIDEVCNETPEKRASTPSVVRISESKVDQKSSGSTVPLTCSNSSLTNDVRGKDAKAISLNTPLKETSMKDVSGVSTTEASEGTTGSSSNDLKNVSNVSRQNCLPSDVHLSEHSTSTSNATPVGSKDYANSRAAGEIPKEEKSSGKSDVQIDGEGSPKCDFSQSSNNISSSGSTLEGVDHRTGCVDPHSWFLIPLIAKLRGKPVVVFDKKCSYESDLDPAVVKSSTFQRDAGRTNISASLTSSVGSDRGFSCTHSRVCSEESGNSQSQNVSKPCVSMVTSQDSTTVGEPYESDKVAEPLTCGKSGTNSERECKNEDSEIESNLSPVQAPVSHKDGERRDSPAEQSTSNNVGCIHEEGGSEVDESNVSNPATEERSSLNEDMNLSLGVPTATTISELGSHSTTGISANLSEDGHPKPSIPPSFVSNYCFINNNQHSLSVPYDSLNKPLDLSQKLPGETASSSVSPICVNIDSAKVREQNPTLPSYNHAAESYAPTTSSSSRYSSSSKGTPENVSGSLCINSESKQRYSEENQPLFSDETQTRNQSLSNPSAEHPESLKSHENCPRTLPDPPRFYEDSLNRGDGASGYCFKNLTSAKMDFTANSNPNEGIPAQSHMSSRMEDPEKNPSKTIPLEDSRSSVSPNHHSPQVLPYSSRFRFAIFRGNWSTSDTGSCKVYPRPEETVTSQKGSGAVPSSDSCRHDSVDKLNNLVFQSGGVCPVDQSSSMFQNPAGLSLDVSESVSVNSFDFPGVRNFTSTPGKVEWKVLPMSLDPPDPTKPIPREIHFKDGTSTSIRLGYSCDGEVSEAKIRLFDFLSKIGIMHVKETNPSAIPVKFGAVKERSESSISISHANNTDERPEGKVVDPIAVSTSELADDSQNTSTLIFDRSSVNEEISGSKILHHSVEGAFKCGTDARGGPSVKGSEGSSPSSSSSNTGSLMSKLEDNHAESSSVVIYPSNSALSTSYENAVMPEKETRISTAVANSTSSRDSRYQSETSNNISQIRPISTVTDAGEGTLQNTSFTCTGMRRGYDCSENEEFASTHRKRQRVELGKSEILMDLPESPRDGNSWQKCASTDLCYRIVRCQSSNKSRCELSRSTSLTTATSSKLPEDDVKGSESAAISGEVSFSAESRTNSDNSESITSNLSVSSSRYKEDAERSETSRVPTLNSGSKIEESNTKGNDVDPEDGVKIEEDGSNKKDVNPAAVSNGGFKIEEENCCGVTPEVDLISESAVEDSYSNSSTLKPTVGLNDGTKPVAVINIDLTTEEDGASRNAENLPDVVSGAVKQEKGVDKSSPSKPAAVINIDLTTEEDGASRNAENQSGVVSGAVNVEEGVAKRSSSKPLAIVNIDLTTEEDGTNRNANKAPVVVNDAVKIEEGVAKSSPSKPAAVINIDLTTEEDDASRNAENPSGVVSGAVNVEEVISKSSASKPVAVINIDLTTEEDGASRNAENLPGVVSGGVNVKEGVAKSRASEPATEEGGTNHGDERPAALLKGDLKMENECTNCSDMSFAVSITDPTIEESCSKLSGVKPRAVLNAHLTNEEDGTNKNAINAAAVSNGGIEIEEGGTISSSVKALAVTNSDSTTEEDGANRKSSKPAAHSNSGIEIGKGGTKSSAVTPEVILITKSTFDESCNNGRALKPEAACNSNFATEEDGMNRIGMNPTAILNIKSTTEENGKDSSALNATPTLNGGVNIEEGGTIHGGVKPTAVLNRNSTTKGDNSNRKDVNPEAVLNNSVKIEEVGTVSIGVKEAAISNDRRSKKYGTNTRSVAVLNCHIKKEDGSCCSAVNASATRTSMIQTDSSKASINSIQSSLTKPSNSYCNRSLKGYPNGSKQNPLRSSERYEEEIE